MAILEVQHIEKSFGATQVLQDISFGLERGQALAIIGSSGSGKTTIGRSIIRINPISGGAVLYKGERVWCMISREMDRKVTRSIQMIFQDPMTALNPVYTIGFQIGEDLKYHTDLDKKARRARTLELLTQMGISTPEKRIDQYPHEFSGGMRQRAMIAMAMSCNPKVLIADERW